MGDIILTDCKVVDVLTPVGSVAVVTFRVAMPSEQLERLGYDLENCVMFDDNVDVLITESKTKEL